MAEHTNDKITSEYERNTAHIRELFPHCVFETSDEDGTVIERVDLGKLAEELGVGETEDIRERFTLNWPGKKRSIENANSITNSTLHPDRDKSVNFDQTKNIVIEGENLEVLKVLQEAYLGKVKLIYLDPPYNTGSDFLYVDRHADAASTFLLKSGQITNDGNSLVAIKNSSGRLHSNWLSMMYARLKLLRNFLRSDGIIVISIDDNELHNLLVICNEIFGRDSFLGLMPVVNNRKGRNSGSFHSITHEYMIAFHNGEFVTRGLKMPDEKLVEFSEISEDGRRFKWDDLRKRGGEDRRVDREDMYFPLYVDPDTLKVELEPTKDNRIKVLPKLSSGEDGRWRWGRARVEREIATLKGRPIRKGTSWGISFPVYFDTDEGEKRVKPKSVWEGSAYSSDAGTRSLNALIEGINAKEIAPKPVQQLKDLFELCLGPEDLVLDAFGGSGTTAEALYQLNSEDLSSRNFIIIQAPEELPKDATARNLGFENIAQICRERVKRAGDVISDKEKTDTGFRFFRLGGSSFTEVARTPGDTAQAELLSLIDTTTASIGSQEALLFEIILTWGLEPTLTVEKLELSGGAVYSVDQGSLIASFHNQLTEDLATEIAKLKPLRSVFLSADIESDSTLINVQQIFQQVSQSTDIKII